MIDIVEAAKAASTNVNPPLRVVGYLMRLLAEELLGRPDGDVGLRRATHVIAFVEIVHTAYAGEHGSGFFSKEIREQTGLKLATAVLRLQESRFRDIFAWDADRVQIRVEMRSNLMRLLNAEPTECLQAGLELHVLWQLYALNHLGHRNYLPVFDGRDLTEFPQLNTAATKVEHAILGGFKAIPLSAAA